MVQYTLASGLLEALKEWHGVVRPARGGEGGNYAFAALEVLPLINQTATNLSRLM